MSDINPYKLDKLRLPFKGSDDTEFYYSSSGQDLLVLCLLDGVHRGRYLELGSGRPVAHNNTYLLESKYNFTGLGIDVDKDLVDLYNKIRYNKAVLGDAKYFNFKDAIYNLGWRLNEPIDYVSIDCDPSINSSVTTAKRSNESFHALCNLLLQGLVFKIITFEHDCYRYFDIVKNRSRKVLESFGYQMVAKGVIDSRGFEFEDWWINPNYINKNRASIIYSENKIWNDIIFKYR